VKPLAHPKENVERWLNSMVANISIVNGLHKPTNITGGHHPVAQLRISLAWFFWNMYGENHGVLPPN
jgi:hypothetical protein